MGLGNVLLPGYGTLVFAYRDADNAESPLDTLLAAAQVAKITH